MADLTYRVAVDTAQAQRGIDGLKTALAGLAAAFSIRQIAQFGDSITRLKNQLATITPTLQGVEQQFKAIAAIAIASRTPLQATGDLYFRIARAADALGISQREAAQITDTLAKGIASSGLSAQEAAGPLLQLGQALQSGRFQGDELRSILEGMPIVAQALADELGVTVGQLRQLGSEGKITGDVFVRAMRNSRDAIVEAFGRTAPTIGQAFDNLRTAAALAFNEFERNTGTGRSAAAAIELIGFSIFRLSQNIDAIMGPLTTFVKIAATLVAFTVAGRALGFFASAVTGVLRAFTGFGRTIAEVVDHLRDFIVISRAAGGGLAGIGTAINFVLQPLGRLLAALGSIAAAIGTFLGLDKLFQYFKDLGDSQGQAQKDLQAYREELSKFSQGLSDIPGRGTAAIATQVELNKKIAQGALEIRNAARAYADQTAEFERGLRIQRDQIGQGELQIALENNLGAARSSYLAEANRLQDQLRQLKASSNEEDKANIPVVLELIAKLDQTYRDHLVTIEQLTRQTEDLNRVRNLQKFSTEQALRVEDELLKIQREMARSSMTEIERKYQDIRDAADDAAQAAIRAEEARRGAPLDRTEIEDYYRAARVGQERLIRATEQHVRQQRSWSTGWNKAMREYIDNATNAARTAENIFTKATKGMEDAIVGFVKTGKFEWRDFVNMMLEELLRAQIQQVFAQIMGNMQRSMGGVTGGGGRGAPAAGGGGLGGLLGSLGSILGGGSQRPGVTVGTPGFGGGQGAGGILGTLGSIGGTISKAGSWINKNIFGGFFANGGTLPAGKIGIVGERGPEMISGPATITPMAAQVTYNINAVDAASFRALVARDPSFIYAVTEQGRRSVAGARA